MDRILYSPKEGTTGFWGLRDVPEEPTGSNYHAFGYASFEWKTFGYEVEIEKYNAALESCKSNNLEIVSMEGHPHFFGYFESKGILKPGDIFSIPEGWDFKEEELPCRCERDGTCHCFAGKCEGKPKVLRLLKTETKASVKSEFQWVYAIDRLPQHMVSRPLRINANYYAGYYYYSLKRFMCPNIGPQGLPINLIEWLEEVPQPEPEESQECLLRQIFNITGVDDLYTIHYKKILSQFTIQRKKQ